MAEKSTKMPFRPVRGTEEKILAASYEEGKVYFSTDTKKIYLDANGDRLSMGGNSGIYYATKNFGTEIPEDQTEFEFSPEDLDINNDAEKLTYPNIDDLILNTADGGFYRVIEITTESIITNRLSISGTGNGGVTTITRPSLSIVEPFVPANLVNGQTVRIYFIATSANDENGQPLADQLTITYTLAERSLGTTRQYATGTKLVDSGKTSFIEFTNIRDSATTVITLVASGMNHDKDSPTRQVTTTTSVLSLRQSQGFNAASIYPQNGVNLKCDVDGTLPRILDFYFDNELVKTSILNANSVITQECAIPISKCTHGSHSVKIELYYNNGSQDEPNRDTDIIVEPLKYEIGVYEVGNETPIIWFGDYKSLYYNYDSILIPYRVYNPKNTNEATVNLSKNNVVYRELIITNLTGFNYWEIANADMGPNDYSISCGSTSRSIHFDVEQDPNRAMEITKQDNLVFNFNPAGRTNQESAANRETYIDRGISAQFKNFNWYSNGWKTDSDNRTYLSISNGARLEIPLGTTYFGQEDTSRQSNTIEMQIKIHNIQKYANLITNVTRYTLNKEKDDTYYKEFLGQTIYDNYDAFLQNKLGSEYDNLKFDYVQKNIDIKNVVGGYYNIDSESGTATGICLGTQDTFFTNGGDTVNVSFVEEDMINLTYEFQYDEDNNSKLLIYINGAITGVILSKAAKNFLISDTSFVFDSANCDIDLYKLRVYNTALTVSDICMNYAVDRLDITTYDQNSLAEFNGLLGEYQLLYSKIGKYNEAHPNAPLMPYLIFDTSANVDDKLPYVKGKDITVKMEFVNTPLEMAYQRGELETLAREDKLISNSESDRDKIDEAVRFYYEHHCPSWTSELTGDIDTDRINLSIQGTSSQLYPRKNFKGKAKASVQLWNEDTQAYENGSVLNIYMNRGPFEEIYNTDKANVIADRKKYFGNEECRMSDGWYLDNYTNATDRWTFKIDYMESSGSYNAGFANMVADAYSKHPLKDYLDKGAIKDPKNKLYSQIPDTNEIRWKDYRTSMEGFPVMAFQKKKDGTYTFIGYYRMLIDKGSSTIMGFKPNKAVVSSYFKDSKGKEKKISDIAECWEFSANNRKFCSFRDPENRVQLSFKGSPGSDDEFDGELAPWVVQNFEYRYHHADDSLDALYTFATQDQSSLNSLMDDIRKDLDLTEKELPTPSPVTDKANPTAEDKINARIAQEATLRYYSNWEKACQWVWSTNLDNVASQGTYELVSLGKQEYKPSTFYVYDDSTDTYVICDDLVAKDDITYYEQATRTDGTIFYRDAYICKDDQTAYEKGVYYVKTLIQDKERYSLTNDDFSSVQEYYSFKQYDAEKLATIADLLVTPATGTFNPEETYYTYDGSVKVNAGSPTGAVQKVDNPQEKDFAKYYVAKPVVYGSRSYAYDTKEYRSAKFSNELSKHFDPEYMATYFIMTEVFECYDSRGKNCMMASWGPLEEGGDYIWYPIFYDIDTQLGINNSGIPSFEFNVDATEANNYSTSDSILWNNFYTLFKNSYILTKYQQLRGTVQSRWPALMTKEPPLKTVSRLEGWYNFDPDVNKNIACRGKKPLIATNLDMYYKYITITNPNSISQDVGFLDGQGNMILDNGAYFYALQGDRSQSRKQFLTNRLEYIDSWLNQGNYARGGSNLIYGRISANNMDGYTHSDTWIEPDDGEYWVDGKEFGEKTHEFDAQYWVDFTPIRSSYVALGGDGNATYPSQKYDGINPVKFKITEVEHGVRTSRNYTEQLLYLYGMNQIQDLGDLSKLYWAEFVMQGNFNKMTSLRLGDDRLGKNGERWYNRGLLNLKGLQPMPLLKEMNLSNLELRDESTLSLEASEKLENFRAIGAQNITTINFAEGVALNTLYMPRCAFTLGLVQANLLTDLIEDEKDTVPTVVDGATVVKPGLYLEGFFDSTSSSLNTINLIGGNLKEKSYKILKRFYELHKDDNKSAKVSMQEVEWCPLEKVYDGEKYNDSNTYYKDNGHYGFEPYIYDDGTYNNLVLNGELYKGTLPDSYLIDDEGFNVLTELQNSNRHFQNANGNSKPYISGIIYINNTIPIEESKVYELQDKYPKLTFFLANVKKAYSAKFLSFDEETQSYQYVKFEDANITKPSVQKISVEAFKAGKVSFDTPIGLYNPTKTHYDFKGWCTDSAGNGTIYNADTPWAETIQENEFDYTYYAIYTVHPYIMSFYNWDGKELIETIEIPYGSYITVPKVIPYRDASDLELYEAYDFSGYSLSPGGEATAVEKMLSISDRSFYAVFKKVSDIRKIIHPEYFEATDFLYRDSYTDYDGYFANRQDRVPQPEISFQGCLLHIKKDLVLKGKITIPTKFNGQYVVGISFNNNNRNPTDQKITHVFLQDQKESKLYVVGSYSFNYCETLKYFDFSTIRNIESHAFYSCHLDAKLFSLGQNTYIVGDHGLDGGIEFTEPTTLLIPSNIRYVGVEGFSNFINNNIKGNTLQIGTSKNEPSKLRLNYGGSNGIEKFTQNLTNNDDNMFSNYIIYSDIYKSLEDITLTVSGRNYTFVESFIRNYQSASGSTWAFS